MNYCLPSDLHKAYDSMPRTALWQILEKSGVPPRMLQIIRSFYRLRLRLVAHCLNHLRLEMVSGKGTLLHLRCLIFILML